MKFQDFDDFDIEYNKIYTLLPPSKVKKLFIVSNVRVRTADDAMETDEPAPTGASAPPANTTTTPPSVTSSLDASIQNILNKLYFIFRTNYANFPHPF
ncbi:unnamed protein product [Rhizophagus irregularis]|nr:unnamed protein product [Rhizophagus irregularis]